MKMDAVPGRTTEMYVTPTQTGAFADDTNLRVQCAELCGTGHPNMQMEVLVLEPEEFEQWVTEAQMMVSN
jgi:cytochrome c oxidase subunit 2